MYSIQLDKHGRFKNPMLVVRQATKPSSQNDDNMH